MRIGKRYEKTTSDSRIWEYKLLGFTYLTKERKTNFRSTKFLGITISSHKQNLTIVNSLDLKQLFSRKVVLDKSGKKIDIIIPIYNGYEYLPDLFSRIKSYTDLDYHLVVVDDCSSDKKISLFLEKQKNIFNDKLSIIKNETNLGFLKSVNKAIKQTSNHVVLINTDVVLPPNWASKLLRPIFMNNLVASVTPFSNAATIFSLPIINIDNPFKSDIDQANTKLCNLNTPFEKLHFSTGVGFCMALNRNTLNKIGLFDEIYEKGYGEENDWCQRAIKAGFFNTIAGDLFVWHKHGGSFDSEEKKKLIRRHLEILTSRFPKYKQETQKIIHNEDYLSLRFIANLLLFNGLAPNTEIWFDHTWGGGTELYTKRQFEILKGNTLCIRIQEYSFTNTICLSYSYKDYTDSMILNYEDTFLLLEQLSLSKIVLNNVAGYKNIADTFKRIKKLKEKKNSFVSFRTHDFQCLCPKITLINYDNRYCNCSSLKDCEYCLKKSKKVLIKYSSLSKYQETWKDFLHNCVDEIITFSQSTTDILTKIYPHLNSKIQIIPHFIPTMKKIHISPHSGINIGVLGNINIEKGMNIISDMHALLKKHKDIRLIVIGKTLKKIFGVKVLGKYTHDDLPKIMEKNKIDIVFIPSIWPETFSYTTAEAMSMGLPVACFNIGAPAERVRAYQKGLIIEEIDAKVALQKIINFAQIMKEEK